MGYNDQGQPFGLTFIAPNREDKLLFDWAAAYEKMTKHRVMPQDYKD
jgi:amidase